MYEPLPTLTYHWDPSREVGNLKRHVSSRTHGKSFDLAPHPADPLSNVHPASPTRSHENGEYAAPDPEQRSVAGQELYVYYGNGGYVLLAGLFRTRPVLMSCSTFTFWRFMIEIPLASHEMKINYTINNGLELSFHVPGRNQNMRWAAYSVSMLCFHSVQCC